MEENSLGSNSRRRVFQIFEEWGFHLDLPNWALLLKMLQFSPTPPPCIPAWAPVTQSTRDGTLLPKNDAFIICAEDNHGSNTYTDLTKAPQTLHYNDRKRVLGHEKVLLSWHTKPDTTGQAGFSQQATEVTLVHSNKHPVMPRQRSASPAPLPLTSIQQSSQAHAQL